MVGKPVILLVDDEEDILESMRAVFQRDMPMARVLTASSGQAALEAMRREPVSLILTDYRMPGMDGFQFIEAAREVAPQVPVIMMTAYPDPQVAARAVTQLGVGLMVVKPFELDYLMATMRSILQPTPRPVSRAPGS